MSKSRGNVVDPWDMIDKFGVDALRWYLIAVSPPWVPTRFDEDGVREIALRFFGTLQNVYAFFTLYANIDNLDPREFDIPVKDRPEIDRWVISRVNSLAKTVRENMESYELTKVVRAISCSLWMRYLTGMSAGTASVSGPMTSTSTRGLPTSSV